MIRQCFEIIRRATVSGEQHGEEDENWLDRTEKHQAKRDLSDNALTIGKRNEEGRIIKSKDDC